MLWRRLISSTISSTGKWASFPASGRRCVSRAIGSCVRIVARSSDIEEIFSISHEIARDRTGSRLIALDRHLGTLCTCHMRHSYLAYRVSVPRRRTAVRTARAHHRWYSPTSQACSCRGIHSPVSSYERPVLSPLSATIPHWQGTHCHTSSSDACGDTLRSCS